MVAELPVSRSGKSALEIALGLIHGAGAILVERFSGEKRVVQKGRGNIVTDVDHEVEHLLLQGLKAEYPEFSILAEESGLASSGSVYRWIVDPLDGTRNYASGVPIYSVTMALAKDHEVLLGLTYDPVRGDLFRAERGRGAFLNDTPIAVSQRPNVRASVIALDMGYSDSMARYALQLLDALWPGMQTIRIMGSAALGLAYVAAGRIDLYFHHVLAPWDIAAGVLLTQEAGGVVTDRDGQAIKIENTSIIAANAAVHADFLRLTEGLKWRSSTP